MPSTTSHPPFKSAAIRRGVLGDAEKTAKGDRQNIDGGDERRPFISIAQPSAAPALAPQRGKEWRAYPKVPFYAVMQGLQLVINVAGPEEDAGDGLNGAGLLRGLSMLQELLQASATKYGGVYYISALPASRNTLLYPAHATRSHTGASALSSVATAAELDYWKYLQALQDVFYRFAELRDLCCTGFSKEHCTHHVFFLRITEHPRLKDLMAMLAIENSRLCFCLCASSRVTQQYFTQRAQDVGVELEWVLGSTLVTEPERLAMTEVNPVFALWDVFVNLPLHTTFAAQEASGAAAMTLSPDGVTAERFLQNINVTLVSSLRFAGSEWSSHTVRLCEVGQLSESGRRRLVWSLMATPCVVLPQLVSGLVRCLVEESPVDYFEMRFTHDMATATGREGAENAGRGVAYVTGARRGVVQRKSASSTSNNNFCAFSRLSAEAWLSDDDRRYYGLFLKDDPVPLECEFTVESLRYRRQAGQNEPTTGDDVFHPQCWGCGFQMENHVERILVDDEE
ncbi:hypothetical protein TcYC6_0047720 [Trypanosoma cruzi]|nr:hypothetical protein TcYC6_0047720 [Trypanosoma cruzi]